MKNFMLFASEDYYPDGGMEVFVDYFESLDEILQKVNESNSGTYDWAHAYCREDGRVFRLSKDSDDRWHV